MVKPMLLAVWGGENGVMIMVDSVAGGVSNLAGMGLSSYLKATTNVGIALSETLAGTGLGALNNLITKMYKAFSQAFDNIEQKLNNARGE